jgi:hypothetical protein
MSGDFIVEEVEGDGGQLFRRLIFLNNQGVIQSEACLKLCMYLFHLLNTPEQRCEKSNTPIIKSLKTRSLIMCLWYQLNYIVYSDHDVYKQWNLSLQ